MKKIKRLWIASVCVLLFLTGCKKEQDIQKQPDAKEQEQENRSEEPDIEQAAENPETGIEGQENVPRDLTSEELRGFTQWINGKSNYGFLLSEYTRPQDVDLSQVFYSGAGIETAPLSKAEEEAN